MLVQQILNAKPMAGVTTIMPGLTLRDAVKILSEKRIGAVIVSSDGKRVAGILSERDVVRELGRSGPAALDTAVEKVMTAAIVGCTRSDTADQVLERMTAGRFRHMPVMESGEMVGLISIGDVVKARLDELAMEKDALEGMIKGF
jgi:CBS domain-containing protein